MRRETIDSHLSHGYLPARRFQQLLARMKMIQDHEVGNQSTIGSQAIGHQLHDVAQAAARSTDEHGIRVGQLRQPLGSLTMNDPQGPGKSGEILTEMVNLLAIRVNRLDKSVVDEAGCLEANRTAAGANIPDDVSGRER